MVSCCVSLEKVRHFSTNRHISRDFYKKCLGSENKKEAFSLNLGVFCYMRVRIHICFLSVKFMFSVFIFPQRFQSFIQKIYFKTVFHLHSGTSRKRFDFVTAGSVFKIRSAVVLRENHRDR